MDVYHYKNSALIDRIEVESPRPGIAHATIIARAGADAAGLECILMALGEHSLSTLMDTKDGRATIQVRGLKRDAKLLFSSLEKLGLGENAATKEETAAGAKQSGFFDRVRGKATFLSALWYDVGNILCIMSGIQHGRHNPDGKFSSHDRSEIMTGVTFGIGDALMTIWGGDKGDEELKAAQWGLKRHLHQKGIKIPQGDALGPDTLHQSGVLKAADRWLRKHVIHIKCLSETVAGLYMIHAGLKIDEKTKTRNTGRIVAGILVAMGWLSTFLLSKPRGHHIFDDDKNGSASFADKMANNPRGWIARPLAMGNNVANIIGSINERGKTRGQVGQSDYMLGIFSASSFLVANSIFGLSDSKQRPHETEDDKRVMNDLVLLSANVLVRQPEAIRTAAEYVSKLAHVRMTKEQVETAIRDKVASLAHSSWVSRVQTESAPGLER